MKNRKNSLILLVCIIATIVAGQFLVGCKETVPSYTNKALGYSIILPKSVQNKVKFMEMEKMTLLMANEAGFIGNIMVHSKNTFSRNEIEEKLSNKQLGSDESFLIGETDENYVTLTIGTRFMRSGKPVSEKQKKEIEYIKEKLREKKVEFNVVKD
ncbi:hypothetical protein PV797_02300 [Clostridiaceae bacterium M8S5]|nr:hypothetical protein PV797_02300 [Clostridiaceae bacterium M8S5]